MPKSYSELVTEAEQAVLAVKSPELKRVAFEKILDDLLTGTQKSSARKRKGKAPAKVRSSIGSKARKGGTMTYVRELVEDEFFKKVKTMGEVKAELQNRGHHIPFTSLSGPLQKLCWARILRRQKIDKSGKKTFGYSNW
jgi:hypothetical protein